MTMTTFPMPELTPPASVETLDAARDALDRANLKLIDAAIRAVAQERAAMELAQTLGRLLAVAETGRLDLILPTARAIRKQYEVDHYSPRTH